MGQLMSVKEVSQALNVHPFSLRRFESRGELLPLQRVGERRVYLRDDVVKFAEKRAAAKVKVAG